MYLFSVLNIIGSDIRGHTNFTCVKLNILSTGTCFPLSPAGSTSVSVISVNHTKRELNVLIVQTAYSVYSTIRQLKLLMSL